MTLKATNQFTLCSMLSAHNFTFSSQPNTNPESHYAKEEKEASAHLVRDVISGRRQTPSPQLSPRLNDCLNIFIDSPLGDRARVTRRRKIHIAAAETAL